MSLSFDLNEEQRALVETARAFTRDKITPVAAKADHDAKFPDDVYMKARLLAVELQDGVMEAASRTADRIETLHADEPVFGRLSAAGSDGWTWRPA